MKIASIVPLKLNSRRLPNKNFLRLGDHPLARHIFDTLQAVEELNYIYCYCSQPQVMQLLSKNIRFLARPEKLDGDDIKANELFRYAIERIDADLIILCHATAPFISSKTIKNLINAVKLNNYDSATTATKLQTYCWFKNQPLNYNPNLMAQTQELTPVYAETSGVYVFRKADYLKSNTRINGKVFFEEVGPREAVDIDNPEDFALAKNLLNFNPQYVPLRGSEYFVNLMNSSARKNEIKLVTFDLDGVLIDSIEAMKLSWSEACKKAKINIPFKNYASLIGYPFLEILRKLNIEPNLYKTIEKSYNDCSLSSQDKILSYPGVQKELLRLKKAGINIAVATSKNRERTQSILKNIFAEIDFDYIATPDDVKPGRGKPHPDQLLHCALATGIDPWNSVYIGDMEVDKEASQRAGFQFVHAGWGYGSIKEINDIWFASIKDFVDYLIS